MNRITLGAALAALSLALPAGALAQRNSPAQILIVDTDRILNECAACRTAGSQLQQQIQQAQQRAQQLSQTLQTERTAIETAVRALSGRQPDAALQQRIQRFTTQENSANQELQGREQTIRSIQANVNRQIGERLGPILTQLLQTRNAAVIMSKNATLAHNPALEVTNEVMATLNQQLPSVSVTPLPAQQPAPTTPRPQGR